MPNSTTDEAVRATAGEVWPVGDGSYVNWCGNAGCPACEAKAAAAGKPVAWAGYNNRAYPGRLCQYGAMTMAREGKTYRQILAHYYGPAGDDGDGDPNAGAEEGAVGGSYPEIKAYTWDGKPTTVEALQARYKFRLRRAEELGTVAVGDEVYRVTALREKAGTTAIIVRCLRGGRLDVGQKVAGYWPGAPAEVLPHQWYDRYVIGDTNANGEVTAVTMGSGGVIHAEGGPHAVWAIANSALSDCVDRLGWDGSTDHWHVDVELSLVVQEAAIETPSQPETPTTETPVTGTAAVKALRWQAEEAVREIERAQLALTDARERLLKLVIAPAYELEGVEPPSG